MALCTKRRVVAMCGRETALSPAEALTLEVISTSPRRVWSVQEVADACYLAPTTASSTLSALRAKLGEHVVSRITGAGAFLIQPCAVWIGGLPAAAACPMALGAA